jgi:hypothetical protein
MNLRPSLAVTYKVGTTLISKTQYMFENSPEHFCFGKNLEHIHKA